MSAGSTIRRPNESIFEASRQEALGGHYFDIDDMENSVTNSSPIHALRERLETARMQAIEELAAKGGPLPADALQKIALLHSALSAVRDEIESHEVKIGGGAEQPLK
jgi:hypothetical protein